MCEGTVQVVLGDIFGRQVELEQIDGLVDAVNEEEFDDGVQCHCHKWQNLDSVENGPMYVFSEWFKWFKCRIIKQAMLRPVRDKSRTRESSRNVHYKCQRIALLKNQVEYKKSDVPVFLDKLHGAIK